MQAVETSLVLQVLNRNGTGPSRLRARDSASSEGNTTVIPRAANVNVPASLRITRPPPMSMNNANAST
jgi:hypothetical protein